MVLFVATSPALRAQVTQELDAYWAEISRTVEEGDFAGYSATYHPDAVVIFGMATQPISEAQYTAVVAPMEAPTAHPVQITITPHAADMPEKRAGVSAGLP